MYIEQSFVTKLRPTVRFITSTAILSSVNNMIRTGVDIYYRVLGSF